MRVALGGIVILATLAADTLSVSTEPQALRSSSTVAGLPEIATTSLKGQGESENFDTRVKYEDRLEQRIHELLDIADMRVKVNVDFNEQMSPVDAWAVIKLPDRFLSDEEGNYRRALVMTIEDAVAMLLPKNALRRHFEMRSLGGTVRVEPPDNAPRVHIFSIP